MQYVGARHPGSSSVRENPGIASGANCQLFAYAVLRHFGLRTLAMRSSELWADTRVTTRVSVARPLDLALFNTTSAAFGAHVGVWVGPDEVLHLSAEVGRPAVWRLNDFAARPRYQVLIGTKSVLREHTGEPVVPPR